jgi:hypothetical protein
MPVLVTPRQSMNSVKHIAGKMRNHRYRQFSHLVLATAGICLLMLGDATRATCQTTANMILNTCEKWSRLFEQLSPIYK